ncbi:GntR family transcriptional regulator [Variovorax sp. RHLX14]|uniref:GntR family transcriptional regulator n=1 Tax=Variovorax sp. RHLX14 TaxID=1259731 RepID=UPI003F47864A
MNSSKPRFADIARHLQQAITTGHFAIGSLLPTELELSDHYGTSRHTVRMALQELQQSGLVSRRKNVGTRVESATPQTAFQQSLASVEDLMQFGAAHVRLAPEIEQVATGATLARTLCCVEGTRWLRISSLRMEEGIDGQPIGWTDIYADPAHEGLEARVRAAPETLVSALIERHYDRRVAEIVQEVRAVEAPAATARRLGIEPGSAALQIVRRYIDPDGAVFLHSVSVHPAERFFVTTRLKRFL